MARARRSGGSCVIFVFSFALMQNREPKWMKVVQSPDTIVSCLLFSLCFSTLLSAAALGTLVVLGVQLLSTSKPLKKKQMKLLMMPGGFKPWLGYPSSAGIQRGLPVHVVAFVDENTYKDKKSVQVIHPVNGGWG
jgi:hypothetical protein